jgi:ssDNA-binding replication factor A large subunit
MRNRMKIADLRPGMERVNLNVALTRLDEPRKVTTYFGVEHVLVEGEVEDETGRAVLTVWNELIEQFEDIEIGCKIQLKDSFITSFKGVIQVNVGRDSEVIKMEGC